MYFGEGNSRESSLTQALLGDGEDGQNAQGDSGWHLVWKEGRKDGNLNE